jgi:hypothetical protein
MNIAFVVPGKDFSKTFVESWTNLILGTLIHGIMFRYYPGYSPVIHETRNICMGADPNGGKNQIPFDGWDYDYILFIDSDMIFNFLHLKTLLDHDKDIVTGWYALQLRHNNNERLASILNWNNSDTFPNQIYTVSELSFRKEDLMDDESSLMKVDATGMGFILVKRGVFEKIGFPWFYPTPEEIESINKKSGHPILHTIREDIVWCEKVTSLGFDIWADIKLRLGHEKRMAI